MTILGTRPEAIKMAPIIKELEKKDLLSTVNCCTGQHEELIRPVLENFNIENHYQLKTMKKEQSLSELMGRLLNGLEEVIEKEHPDIIIVQGDTSSTFAGSLAAYYKKIPFAHIEAGLRSGDILNPFPEEGHRLMSSQLARFHFAPTQGAVDNLQKSGVSREKIFLVGNTGVDAVLETLRNNGTQEQVQHFSRKKQILITLHRRENQGENLLQVLEAIQSLAGSREDALIKFILHKNPKVREPVEERLRGVENIQLLEAMPYPEMIQALSDTDILLTDSGGLQEEAPSLGIPILVLRDTTERPEGVKQGTARLVGSDQQRIIEETCLLLDDKEHYRSMSTAKNPYGDGKSAQRIVNIITEELTNELRQGQNEVLTFA